MNSTCIDQPNADNVILNNEDERTRIVDSQTRLQVAKIPNSLKDGETLYEVVLDNERDADVKNAGDSPLLGSEEMGVVNVQWEPATGKRGVDLQHGEFNLEKNGLANEFIRDERTCNHCRSVSTNAITNHEDESKSNSNSISDIRTPHENVESVSEAAAWRNSDSVGGGNELGTIVSKDKMLSNSLESTSSTADSVAEVTVQQNNGNSELSNGEDSNTSVKYMQSSSEEASVQTPSAKSHPISLENDRKMSSNQSSEPECNNANDTRPKYVENAVRKGGKVAGDPNVEDGELRVHIASSTSHRSRRPPSLDIGESSSPATIDVTNSEEWEDASSELPSRPQFFRENLTDFTPSPNSQQSSQSASSWSSQRTLSFSSTPIEKSGSNSGSLQEDVSEDGVVGPSGKTPLAASFVPDDSNNTPTRSRTSTTTSLSTDFSSNVSIATDDLNEAIADCLVLGEDDQGFVDVNLEHGEHGHPPGATVIGPGAKPKKKGLGGFLTRNIFRKSLGKGSPSSPGAEGSPPGWKLFGRVPSREAMHRDHMGVTEDFERRGQTHPPTSSLTWKKRHTGLKEASSTTALILENRPEYLPAKNPEEEEKHKEEYTKMLKEAKKKELKLYKQKLKKMAQQLKYEDGIKSSLHTWQQEILPKWDEVKKHKKTRDLWWQGIPPSIRGRVWMLAIKNELNITHELFEIFLIRAKDKIRMCSESELEGIGLEEIHAASRENSVDVIKLDVARTFPHLCIFQKGGPYFDLLHSILGAYACYRPDVGYVQGMSFIAAVFLLYLDVADAFICFANLLNKSCQLAFFRLDQPVMQSYFASFEEYFQDSLPKLFAHFDELGISPDLYIIDWMYTLYSKSLPLDVACRVWDVFFRDGEELLFRTAVGLLSLYEDILLNFDFIQAAQFLTNIPVDIDSDKLFKHIDDIDMHQKRFGQVLMHHISSNLANHSS